MSIVLKNEAFELGIEPVLGASLLFWQDKNGFNYLRETEPEPTDPRQTAGFPLIPFSNRLKDGRLVFSDHTVDIARFENFPFALHGCGWLEAWDLDSVTCNQVKLSLRESQRWPFLFLAKISYTLSPNGLRIRLAYENLDDRVIPVGLGFHPYFPRKSDAHIDVAFSEAYRADQTGYPILGTDPIQGEPDDADTIFSHPYMRGVTEDTEISWITDDHSLQIQSSPELNDLILFDANDDSFCVEPVSHAINAMNTDWDKQEGLGVRHLQPKTNFQVEIFFSVTESKLTKINKQMEDLHV